FTHFLINGTTVGNHAAMLSVAGPGSKVILPRASHRSLLAAVALADAKPIFIPPVIHKIAGVPLAVDAVAAEQILAKNPDAKALFITSPSYYGLASDVRRFAQLAHSSFIPLVVDEAHGAHFTFHSSLPSSAMQSGADISVQSTHKTLGSLYQSSMLHGK